MTGNLGKDRPRSMPREMNQMAVQVIEVQNLEPEGLVGIGAGRRQRRSCVRPNRRDWAGGGVADKEVALA